jgi:L-aminopeptidase/D-esterase-like protein
MSGGATSFAPVRAAIGHSTDLTGATGCTVIRGIDGPLRGAVAVLGRATGTRELHTLDPGHLADRVDAVLLTGGSAYGLDAAAGVMRWCEERGRGFDTGAACVPLVPAAVIYDLAPLGSARARPTALMAYEACELARSDEIAEGSVGAGAGATVGKSLGAPGAMKGGVGVGAADAGTLHARAVMVVNAFGDVRDATGAIIAGARGTDGHFAGSDRVIVNGGAAATFAATGHNTTIGVVLVNVCLERVALQQLASAATAAFHRCITPAGTRVDGDVLFALCPPSGDTPSVTDGAALMALEALATAAVAQAIERAVRAARGRDGIPGLADRETAQ